MRYSPTIQFCNLIVTCPFFLCLEQTYYVGEPSLELPKFEFVQKVGGKHIVVVEPKVRQAFRERILFIL